MDGTAEEYDCVIAATGYRITTPFFERDFLDFSEGDVPLYLRIFHPDHPSLHFIGLLQPQGCIWPLADTQSELVAKYILGEYDLPRNMQQAIQEDVASIRERFNDAARHSIEVEYHEYLDQLREALNPDDFKSTVQQQREMLLIAAIGVLGAYWFARRLLRRLV